MKKYQWLKIKSKAIFLLTHIWEYLSAYWNTCRAVMQWGYSFSKAHSLFHPFLPLNHSVFVLFFFLIQRNKQKINKRLRSFCDIHVVLLITEWIHPEGHALVSVLQGVLLCLAIKDKPSPPGLKSLTMLVIRKPLLYSIMFHWSWRSINVQLTLFLRTTQSTSLQRLWCPTISTGRVTPTRQVQQLSPKPALVFTGLYRTNVVHLYIL